MIVIHTPHYSYYAAHHLEFMTEYLYQYIFIFNVNFSVFFHRLNMDKSSQRIRMFSHACVLPIPIRAHSVGTADLNTRILMTHHKQKHDITA